MSPQTASQPAFKLIDAASNTWRRLKGADQLLKPIAAVKFADAIEVIPYPEKRRRLIGSVAQNRA
ncbi:hypothetical protein ACYCVF_33725 [Bradyrhizobium sp. 1.29L]